ncbi:MAG TPA: HlyD family efflux transporter periplasmic adaptor subunit [Chthoniobacterales bacterium]|nr:HlyD family efflux transporter periplasmic adaptor subunit [Chthoniobacterales bacterium]
MPAELMQHNAADAESEMLPQDPPPWFVGSLAWLLIAIFGVALLAALVVRLPETVSCPFVLVPAGGADPIQSPRLAVIHQVDVAIGQTVKKGDPLYVLRSDEIRDWGTAMQTLGEDLRTHQEGLAKAEAAYNSALEIKKAEISQAESEVAFREKHASSSRELLERLEKLTASGGISVVEVLQHRLDAAESEKDLSVAQRTLEQVKLERQQMEAEHARTKAENLAEIEKLKMRLSALHGDLENSNQNLLVIHAPYDGVVISEMQQNAGSVVQNGEELCQLARVDAKPRAQLTLSEAGLPQLKSGQRVRLFFDAFPYQRYGVVNAKLDWVSPSAVSSPQGAHFVALASLDETELTKKQHLALRVGMGGEARIVTGQRTMIEYAFEPIRQLRENMRD